MGGWIGIIITAAGAVLSFKLGWLWLGGTAIGIAIVQFWSFGVMHNYANAHNAEWVRNFRQNSKSAGMPDAEIEKVIAARPMRLVPEAAPNWLAGLNMLTTLIGFVILIVDIAIGIL